MLNRAQRASAARRGILATPRGRAPKRSARPGAPLFRDRAGTPVRLASLARPGLQSAGTAWLGNRAVGSWGCSISPPWHARGTRTRAAAGVRQESSPRPLRCAAARSVV